MSAPLSIDLCQRVVKAMGLEKCNPRAAAVRLGVSVRATNCWVLECRAGRRRAAEDEQPQSANIPPHRERVLTLL